MTTALARRIASSQATGHVAPPPPASPSRHNLKLLQIWQWEGRSLQDAIDICKSTGLTGIVVKALDGTMWMGGGIDPSPWALGSPDEVQAQADVAHLNGLYYFVWTNPLAADLNAQAQLTGYAAKACDGLFLDVEPYAQFWGPWRPLGWASSFMQGVRLVAPDAFIALQPDPRSGHLDEIRITEWLPFVDALAGQHYWPDFQTVPTNELSSAAALQAIYRIPVLPTLPGNAPAASFPTSVIQMFPGFLVWRWGSTPAATLSMLGGLTVAGLETSKIAALA